MCQYIWCLPCVSGCPKPAAYTFKNKEYNQSNWWTIIGEHTTKFTSKFHINPSEMYIYMYNKSNDSFGTLPNYPNMPVCLPSGGWSPAAVIHTVSPPALSPAATV